MHLEAHRTRMPASLVELSEKENRLELYDFLARNVASIDASRIFYISLYPNGYVRGTRAALSKLRKHAPFSRDDALILDSSNELNHQLRPKPAQNLYEFCRDTGFSFERVIMSAQGRPTLRGDVPHYVSWLPYHHWPMKMARTYGAIELDDFGIDALVDPEAKFLCLNRTVRSHRLLLLAYLEESGLARSVTKSELAHLRHSGGELRAAFLRQFPGFARLAPADEYVAPPPSADFDAGRNSNFARLSGPVSFPDAQARRTILSVVTETEIAGTGTRITEKSLKPIVHFRPFMIWGSFKSLALLQRFGFRTFGDVIDEAYDDIPRLEERFVYFVNELHRLQRELATPSARRAFIEAVRATCAHNQNHLRHGFVDELDRQTLRALRAALRRPDLNAIRRDSPGGPASPVPAADHADA